MRQRQVAHLTGEETEAHEVQGLVGLDPLTRGPLWLAHQPVLEPAGSRAAGGQGGPGCGPPERGGGR